MRKSEYDRLDDQDEYDIENEISQRLSSWANHESEPLLHEPEETKLKFFPAMSIIIASMTGVGVLAFPASFAQAGGPVYSILLQIPFLFFAWITINAIGLIIRKYKVDEYETMVSACLGERVGQICKVFFLLYCLANCIAYSLIIIDQGKAFLPFMPQLSPLLTLLLFPFSCAENVAFLKYSGYVSITAMIVLATTVTLDYFTFVPVVLAPIHIANETAMIGGGLFLNAGWYDPDWLPSPDLTGLFSSFPVFCFAYQGHMSSVKVYRRIEHPKSYPWITGCAFLICFILYNICGTFAVLTYGTDINGDMLNSYPMGDVPMMCARVGIIGCVMGAYPIFALLGRDILYKSSNCKFRYGFASIWFTIAVSCAMVIPDFTVVSGVIGSMAALLMFVFPGLALMVSFTDRKFYRCIMGCFFVVFGIFLFTYSFINSFIN